MIQSDPILQNLNELWSRGRYYQAIVLLGDDSGRLGTLPPIDAAVFNEIRSAALLEAEWLSHLLSGNEMYQDEEVLLILTKRQNLAIVSATLRRFDLSLNLQFSEIDQAIRNRFAARKMDPVSRRIYHNLYLLTRQD